MFSRGKTARRSPSYSATDLLSGTGQNVVRTTVLSRKRQRSSSLEFARLNAPLWNCGAEQILQSSTDCEVQKRCQSIHLAAAKTKWWLSTSCATKTRWRGSTVGFLCFNAVSRPQNAGSRLRRHKAMVVPVWLEFRGCQPAAQPGRNRDGSIVSIDCPDSTESRTPGRISFPPSSKHEEASWAASNQLRNTVNSSLAVKLSCIMFFDREAGPKVYAIVSRHISKWGTRLHQSTQLSQVLSSSESGVYATVFKFGRRAREAAASSTCQHHSILPARKQRCGYLGS